MSEVQILSPRPKCKNTMACREDETGTSTQVTSLSYTASQPGQDVTVTRWIKYEQMTREKPPHEQVIDTLHT
jgi:hypothetical protein